MIAGVCVLRQIHVDAQRGRIMRSADVFEVEKDTVRRCSFSSRGKTRGHLAANVGIELDRCASPRPLDWESRLIGAYQLQILALGHGSSLLDLRRHSGRSQKGQPSIELILARSGLWQAVIRII